MTQVQESRELPWESIGTSFDPTDSVTVEQAIHAADLDWTVKHADVWSRFQGKLVKAEGFRAVIRQDTGTPLGVVGQVHTPVQNHDAFGALDVLVKDGKASVVSAGELHGGRSAFMVAKIAEPLVIADDEYDGYFFGRNGHDGRGGLTATIHDLRVACVNQLPSGIGMLANIAGLDIRGGAGRSPRTWELRLRHTRTVAERMKEAERIFTHALKARDNFAQVAKTLVTKPFKPQDMKQLMDVLFPVDVEATKIPPRTIARNEKRRELLWLVWNTAEDLDNIRDSAWGAVQAVAEFADHHGEFRTTRRASSDENRMLAILDRQGSATQIKLKALEAVSEMVTVPRPVAVAN